MTSLEKARVYQNMSSLAPWFIFKIIFCKRVIEHN
jgi:hypothetical protein